MNPTSTAKSPQELANILTSPQFRFMDGGCGWFQRIPVNVAHEAARILESLPTPDRDKLVDELPSKYALMGMIEDACGNADNAEQVVRNVLHVIQPYINATQGRK